jgi:hypothetical protein
VAGLPTLACVLSWIFGVPEELFARIFVEARPDCAYLGKNSISG